MKRSAGTRIAGVGLVLLVGVGGLGACTGGSSSKSSAAFDQQAASATGAAGGGAAAPASAAASAASVPSGAPAAKTQVARAVIRTASMSVIAKDVDAAADRVSKLAVEQGGRVDADDRSGADAERTATLVVRVAPARLETAMTLAAAQGKEDDRSLKAQDVTQRTVDTDARVKALTTSVTRLRVLMSHSANVRDLLGVETQLSTREAELESLKAQQTSLAGQVALASLTVSLRAPALVPKPPAKARTGLHPTAFTSAFGSGVHAVAVGLRLVAAGLGYALPVLLPLAFLAAVAWRLRRHRSAPTASVPPAAT